MKNKPLLFSLSVALMLVAAGLLFWMKTHQRLGNPGLRLELPEQVLEYESVPLEVTQGEIVTLPKDTQFARRMYYRGRDGQTNYIQVSIVLMGADRTSIHKPQFCLTGQGWNIERTEETSVAVVQPHVYDLPVMRLTARANKQVAPGQTVAFKAQYVYWFVAENRLTANHWQRMWWMAKNLVTTGVLQRWAYVSCFSACLPGQEEASYQEIQRFIAAAVPAFQTAVLPPKQLAAN